MSIRIKEKLALGSKLQIQGAETLTSTTLGNNVIASSLTSVGTLTSGTWQASTIAGKYGGTGVDNDGKTITLGGNLTTLGSGNTTFNITATTLVTLPTSGTIAADTNTLTFTNKTISLANNTLLGTVAQFNSAVSDGDFATLVGTETFTNKTISLANNSLSGTLAQFNSALSDQDFATAGGTETFTNKTISLANNSLTGTVAEFNSALSNGNFATVAGNETLTNKTINLANNSLSGTLAQFNTALSDQNFATAGGTETFTNKTISLANNSLSGTLAQFNSALSDQNFATLANTETLTNKTINLANNTLTGTVAEFNSALSNGNFATVAGNETLTNKTINLANNSLSGTVAEFNSSLTSANFVTSDATTNATQLLGDLTVSGIVLTNEVRQRTGQQLILNAGEAAGKFSGQTNEYVYVNAESGLMVSTPDRSHSNFQAGYTQDTTVIRGEAITVKGNTVWHAGNDGSDSGLDADLLDGNHASEFASASHAHSFDSLTSKTSGTGDYSTNGDLVSGRGSGGVALTINDGKGNANVTFNHQNGVPEQNGNAARIEVNTDSTTGANMNFELKSGVTSGTSVELTTTLNLTENDITFKSNVVWHAGNDGSGSGLDADTVDGLQASQFLRSDATDSFTDLSGTSITLGAGVKLSEATHRADLLLVQSQTSGWAGIQIDNTADETLWSFMADGTACGIYDDTSNAWSVLCYDGGETRLYYAGGQKLATRSTGIFISGDLTVSAGDIVLNGTGRIQGIDTVSDATDAVNKSYVDYIISGAVTSTTINTSDWTGTGPYTAVKTVSGITTASVPVVDIDLSSVAFANVVNVQADWALVYRVVSSATNQLTFYAISQPGNNLIVNVKVVG